MFITRKNKKRGPGTCKRHSRTRKFESLERRDLLSGDVGENLGQMWAMDAELTNEPIAALVASDMFLTENVLQSVIPQMSSESVRFVPRNGIMDLGTPAGSQQMIGWVGQSNKNDFFRFQVDDQSDVSLRLVGLRGDIDLFLYDARGNELERSWLGGTSNERISITLGPGTYYAKVAPWSYHSSIYRFSIDVDAAGNSLAEARDLGTLADSQQFTDWVGRSDRNDFFQFVVENQSDVS